MRSTLLVLTTSIALAACGGEESSTSGGVADAVAADVAVDGATPAADGNASTVDTAVPSDTSEGDGATLDPPELAGVCALDQRYGAFLVEAQDGGEGQDGFSFVDGSVADGVIPVTILEEVQVVGPCRLLKRNNPFCSPPCGPGQTCDHDGSCIPFPDPQDVGIVEITGLAEEALLEPLQPGNSYFTTTLPHPAFEGGAPIHMTSTEGAFGVLDLRGVGVDVLDMPEPLWEVQEGAELAISWPAPVTPDVPSRVRVDVNIDQHGNSPVVLQCDFSDTGSAVVPAELVDALLTSGVSGYPNGRISRRTVDSAAVGDGCMEFIVASPRVPQVRVVGHTPCQADSDCPDGESCNVAIETCE